MINIEEEIKILLLKKGLSMRKLIKKMNNEGFKPVSVGGFSKSLTTKSIKFVKAQEIIEYLGYKINIEEK